jgi:C-terminal processing protease CtpA/Prc
MTMKKSTKKRAGFAALGLLGLAAAGVAWFGLPGGGHRGPPQKDMAIDAATRKQAIDAAVAHLAKLYVFPDKGVALGKQLQARLQHGDYNKISSAEEFAETLTADLQRDSADKHIEVRYFEDVQALPSASQEAADAAAEAADDRRFNFGFEGVDRLRGNIGYINLHSFSRPANAGSRIDASMSLLADTSALVFDLRDCGGGDPQTVMLVASYLFDRPTHLNDVYWREDNSTEVRWTTATVPGKKYGSTRPVFLLTSADTFSGCEDFAYALKNAGRATLIGETTGGGAHAGSPQRLGPHFMMFVPSGRPINPVTHTDWEGVGVKPDIASSAKDSLELAQIAALKRIVATETDPEWKIRLQHRLDDLQ